MNKLNLNKFINSYFFIFFEIASLAAVIIAIFFAEKKMAVANIAIAVSLVCIFIRVLIEGKWHPVVNPAIILCFLGLFSVFVISFFFNIDPWSEAYKILRNKILWVAIPFVFFFTTKKSLPIEKLLVIVFILFTTSLGIIAIFNYLNVYYFPTNPPFNGAHVIPTWLIPFGFNHHFLAIILVTSCVFTVQLLLSTKHILMKILCGFIILIVAFIIHLSGARIAMILFYVVSFIYFISYFKFNLKSISITLAFGLLLSVLLFLVYNSTTDLKERLNWTKDEIQYIIKQRGTKEEMVINGNLTTRLVSFKNTYPIIRDHFWKGTSLVYYDKYLNTYFDSLNITVYEYRNYPPNQWWRYFISMGVPLTFLFICFFLAPLFFNKNYRDPFILSVFMIIFLYCLSETPLDPTIPYRFSMVSIALCLRYGYILKQHKQIISNLKG